MQRIVSPFSFVYSKVSQLAGNATNFVVSKARGFLEWRLAQMNKRSALIVGLQIENLTLEYIELVFKISLYNPFEFYLPVSHASFKVKSASSEILSGTLKEPTSLKPMEESLLFVKAKVPYSAFMSLARDLSGDADIDYEIHLDIKIKLPIIGNVSLPIPCQQGQFKISDMLDEINIIQ